MTHSDSIWPIQRWLDSIQLATFTCKLWKCWLTLCVHTCAGRRKTLCMKVLRCSRKPVFASVCANSCSTGWWESLLVERGEHCERCKIGVPVVTSAGVTGWTLPRTGWRSITVERCGLLCVGATILCATERDNQKVQETCCTRGTVQVRTTQIKYQGSRRGTSRDQEAVQADLGRKLQVRSTAGTAFLPTNMTRSHFKKLPSTGQGAKRSKPNERRKIAKPSCRAERSCLTVIMVVRSTRTDSSRVAERNWQRSEGAEWIKVEPSKAELPSQANLPNWANVVLYCMFTARSYISLSFLFQSGNEFVYSFHDYLENECVYSLHVSLCLENECVYSWHVYLENE